MTPVIRTTPLRNELWWALYGNNCGNRLHDQFNREIWFPLDNRLSSAIPRPWLINPLRWDD